ncbi:MAG: hypothetical protein JRI55_18095 [Deltaproteobacteria bacterium]|jgi:hypothetical protein|nr:hypothetical protein [Deltaproteobacteria bacterium]
MRASGTRWRVAVLGILGVAHVVVSLVAVVPGYLSVDEVTFHMMVKGLAETGTFEIWNGYREFPSPELASASIVAHDGRLVGQPPYLHPLLGVPFYRALGYRGLFLLNAIAFAIGVWLTYRIGRRLFSRPTLALDACMILVLATFAWEYSQAAWTHATALLFNVGAFYLVVVSLQAGARVRALTAALLAGLVAGFALGIRLDSVLLLAALLVPFLFLKPWRPGSALALVAGALPGALIVSLTNRAKFGTLSPFAMGPELGGAGATMARYLPLAVAALAVFALAFAIRHVDVRALVRTHRRGFVAATVVAVLLVLALPAPRAVVWRQITGTYTVLVDMRALPMDREERAMARSDGRAVVYIGGVKKALSQSLPFLPLVVIPAAAVLRRRSGARELALLALVPLAYIGFYGQYAWHGGLSLNQRYLVPTLPYIALLVAWALMALRDRLNGRGRWAILSGCGLAVAGFAAARSGFRTNALIELQYLALPLALAGALLVALLLVLRDDGLGGRSAGPRLRTAVAALSAATLVWAGLVALAYDYPLARRSRAQNLRIGLESARLVSADSIFFSPALDPFFAMIESDRVRIARPTVDGYGDFPELIRFHLDAGRRVFGAFSHIQWQILARGDLSGYAVTEIREFPDVSLGEIVRPPALDALRE